MLCYYPSCYELHTRFLVFVLDADQVQAGIGSDGSETFTPRTVIYDVKENFGTLRQVNALYEIQDQGETHPGVWFVEHL
jgi:hypothetical protein